MPVDRSKLYDFIFLGAGCASLSIVMRMIGSQQFPDKKILLIDKDEKNKNDRTWCFWENGTGFFEDVVHKKWSKLSVENDGVAIPLDISPYEYKMIRGLDFYFHCFSTMALLPNVDVVYGDITFGGPGENGIWVGGEKLHTGDALVFNSVHTPGSIQKGKFYLKQHFKGWIIETPSHQFDPHHGILMDFRVDQSHGTTFVYLLPLAANFALVEYTLFTKDILPATEYNNQLRAYVEEKLGITDFNIVEEEFGIIPMTNAKFPAYENGMYHIGTSGGQTKPSTGYTFQFIQKQAKQIVSGLIKKGVPSKYLNTSKRFQFYDSTLLHILAKNKLPGKEIFTRLFQKNKASTVFKFLDNETALGEDLKIINSLPKKEFLSAGIREILKRFKV